jgi:WD40 repeat protein
MRSPVRTLARICLLVASLGLATAGCGELTEGVVVSAAYLPDGRILAFGSGETLIFDADAQRLLRTVPTPWRASWQPLGAQLALSTDGTRIAVGNGQAIDIYDVESGTLRAHIVVNEAPEERDPIAGVAFSRDGRLVAVAVRPIYFGPPRLGIWRVDDQSLVTDIPQPTDRQYWSWGAGLAFSPHDDGLILYALDTGDTGTKAAPRWRTALTAWNAKDGTALWEKWIPNDTGGPNSGTANMLALSVDGSTLATAGTEIVRWDTATSTPLVGVSAPSLPYGSNTLVFSPDGRQLVTTHATNQGPDPQIFGPDGSNVRSWTIAESGMCSGATFSADGSRIAAACGQWLRIWDAATGAVIHTRKVTSRIY